MDRNKLLKPAPDFALDLAALAVAILIALPSCSTRSELASTAYGPPANPVLRSALEETETQLEQTRISEFQVDAPAPEAWRQLQQTLRESGDLPEMIGFMQKSPDAELLEKTRVAFSARDLNARELLDRFAAESPYQWEIVAIEGSELAQFIAVNAQGYESDALRQSYFKIDQG